MDKVKSLHGLAKLLVDGVEHGSRAIERVQRDSLRLPFAVLEAVPVLATPAKGVHAVLEAGIGATHAAVRAVARGAGLAADTARDVAAKSPASAEAPQPPAPRDG